MCDAQFIIMPHDEGYMAVSNSHGFFKSGTLQGFGKHVIGQVRQQFGTDDLCVEFNLSDDLKHRFPVCRTCNGSSKVLGDGIEGATVGDESDALDLSKRATATCPACKGLGADMPQFWTD